MVNGFESKKLKFINACVSSGKCVESDLNLTKEQVLEIDDIVNRYNDITAKTKISKVISK